MDFFTIKTHWKLFSIKLNGNGLTNTIGKGMNPIILPPAMGK